MKQVYADTLSPLTTDERGELQRMLRAIIEA